jgi:flavorubredoxin
MGDPKRYLGVPIRCGARGGGATLLRMQTSVHEIADGVYRLSTCVPDVAPGGFTFNQYLVDADEPLLFHTGLRGMFPLVAEAAAKVIDIAALRWVSFGHVEADECGSMNSWLASAPASEVLFNELGCAVSLNDLADRPPRPVADGDVRDLGGHRVRTVVTPHVPHGWEAQVLFDESTRTLLCGDLFSRTGNGSALVHDTDMVTPAIAAEDLFHGTCLTPSTAPTLRRLADLEPRTLALMHGPAFAGDCGTALRELADAYEARLTAAQKAA